MRVLQDAALGPFERVVYAVDDAAGCGPWWRSTPPRPARRSAGLWRAYARVVDMLDGAYYTAEDVGTTVADMAAVRARRRPRPAL